MSILVHAINVFPFIILPVTLMSYAVDIPDTKFDLIVNCLEYKYGGHVEDEWYRSLVSWCKKSPSNILAIGKCCASVSTHRLHAFDVPQCIVVLELITGTVLLFLLPYKNSI